MTNSDILLDELVCRQMLDGWSYHSNCPQAALEPTCLALLALRFRGTPARASGIESIQGVLDPSIRFIQKPISQADLAEKVRRTLDVSTDLNVEARR